MKRSLLSLDRKLVLIMSLTLLLGTLAASAYYLHSEKRNLQLLLLKQTRILFSEVQVMRHWNAGHGGVYTFLREGERTNPYLYTVGPGHGRKSTIEPELTDTLGRKLTLKNPALMTRELAEESLKHTEVRLHLTSLKLVNPHNKPDAFEKDSLEKFAAGTATETFTRDSINGKPYFRYMAPLKVEEACLKCHGFQGYKVGDIRGGLSVSIPMQDELHIAATNERQTFTLAAILYACVVLTLFFSVRLIISRPLTGLLAFSRHLGSDQPQRIRGEERNDEIGELARALLAADRRVCKQQEELQDYAENMEDLSRKDALTGLHNRHYLTQGADKWFGFARRSGKPICTALVDVDHFKEVNDNLGHLSGDIALQQVAAILAEELRTYDELIRYGGDEFLLLFPDTTLEEGRSICDRIRRRVDGTDLPVEAADVKLSISVGIFSCNDCTLDEAIIRADEALYTAKSKGRNRICASGPVG